MAYPIMGIYRKWVISKPLQCHHLFFATTGMCASYLVFGTDGPLHGVLACVMNWMVLKRLGPTKLCTAVVFVVQFGYFCAGNLAVFSTEHNLEHKVRIILRVEFRVETNVVLNL